MKLIWKLLRHHISVAQLAGFFLANLCGMVIVLLSIQFYHDVLPLFTQGDSFMKKDYIVVSKKVSTLGTFLGKEKGFNANERKEIENQPFCESVGAFTSSQFQVSAGVGFEGMQMSTAMFFESVPDAYIDIQTEKWEFEPGQTNIPIIVPRNYLNLYNFGFAQSRNLPQLSEGILGTLSLDIRLRGNGKTDHYKGKIAGFSDRLNTILVPESFMQWANETYADGTTKNPSRLIIETSNPADDRIAKFFKEKGYETENDKLDAGKTVWFLKLIIGIVLSVGVIISLLSFYILMLSIFLLLQKNTTKLENLMLIGHAPTRVSLPYQALTIGLNAVVLVLSVVVVCMVRCLYMEVLKDMAPISGEGNLWMAIGTGIALFILISVFNVLTISRKVNGLTRMKS